MSYDRYSKFRVDGKIRKVPSIEISEKSTDYYEYYRRDSNNLGQISYKYYGDANYDWLILMANPSYTLEYEIPDNVTIRIPYPLEETLQSYSDSVDEYNLLYGVK